MLRTTSETEAFGNRKLTLGGETGPDSVVSRGINDP